MSAGGKKGFDRRSFLRRGLRLGAGGGLYAAMGPLGMGVKLPGSLIPFVSPPDRVAPEGVSYFATICRECPAGCGMLLAHTCGRVIKAEGIPGHPVSDGALCARGQAAVQGLYDPDRLRAPMRRTPDGPAGLAVAVGWDSVLEELPAALGKAAGAGGRVFVLSRLETGALAGVMTAFAAAFGGRAVFWEPYGRPSLARAYAAAFGRPGIPRLLIDRCSLVLGFGAEFLETWVSNVEFARLLATMRSRPDRPGRYVHVGSRLSMTAANADLYVQVPAGAEADLAAAVLKVVLDRGWAKPGLKGLAELAAPLVTDVRPQDQPLPDAGRRIEWLARELSASGLGLVLPGPAAANGPAAERLELITALLNLACGGDGITLDLTRTHALGRTATDAELEALVSGLTPADAVVLHRLDLAYLRPGLADGLRRAGTLAVMDELPGLTGQAADWVLPLDSPYESWGDYEPWSGLRGLMQPAMAKLWDTRPAADALLQLALAAGKSLRPTPNGPALADFTAWLEGSWQASIRATAQGRPYGEAREQALRRGYLVLPASGSTGSTGSAGAAKAPSSATEGSPKPTEIKAGTTSTGPEGARTGPAPAAGQGGPEPAGSQSSQGRLRLLAWPSVLLYDGRLANRGWLQETPDPVSSVAWGNTCDLHPDTARALGVKAGDQVEVTRQGDGEGTIRLPARLTPDVAIGAAAVSLGHGNNGLGGLARDVGANAFVLLGGASDDLFTEVTVKPAGRYRPVLAYATQDQHRRDLLQWTDPAEVAAGRAADEVIMPDPPGYRRSRDLYGGHEHAGHRWAMAVDLDRCVGCTACRVACYAENNVPVVGAQAVARGREMAWMRIIPYRHPEHPGRVNFMPLACQHCDAAPCEPVCPVFASVHNDEGLNAQVYNRCIGTRYCAQNCPYKVRKFNWIDGQWKKPLDWQLNPDVTVRVRGVMEKCTFCIQRIRQAEYLAKIEDRPVRDGEVVPACVQTCPAKVFTFGDLLDPKSAISRLFRESPRRYQLLAELNTKPGVLFLKRVLDPALIRGWEGTA